MKVLPPSAAPPDARRSAACKPDAEVAVPYDTYVALHKATLDRYASRVRSPEENLAFLEEHPALLHEHAMGYLLLEALELGMAGKAASMKRVTKQKYHIKSLLDFASVRKTNIRSVVRPFFTRLAADAGVLAEYDKSFEELHEKLVARAAEKKREREAAAAAEPEELTREERLGPGGLDPVEVFESLPAALQKAYEEKDVQALRDFIEALPPAEGKKIMRDMAGSGLWVAEAGAEGTYLQPDDC